jgi:hypothetical protein
VDILAGILGVIAGLIGILPFIALSKLMRHHASLRSFGLVPAGLLGTVVSFALLMAALLICATIAHAYLIVFAVACIAVFLVGTCIYAWRVGKSTISGEDLS